MGRKMTPSRDPRDVFVLARAYLLRLIVDGVGDQMGSQLRCIRADLETRGGLGMATPPPLQPDNGQDWLVDTYEKLLDALAYTEQGVIQSDTARNIRENVITALLECATEFGDRDMDNGYLANRPKDKTRPGKALSWTEYLEEWAYATDDEE